MKNMTRRLMVVIAMYIGLNEACSYSKVEIHNQLPPGPRLQVHCRGTNPTIDLEAEEVNRTVPYIFEFREDTILIKRKVWHCLLWYREIGKWGNGYYCDIWRAYRSADVSRCGQLRSYTAKPDGIYFTRKRNTPPTFAFQWTLRNPPHPPPTPKRKP